MTQLKKFLRTLAVILLSFVFVALVLIDLVPQALWCVWFGCA